MTWATAKSCGIARMAGSCGCHSSDEASKLRNFYEKGSYVIMRLSLDP